MKNKDLAKKGTKKCKQTNEHTDTHSPTRMHVRKLAQTPNYNYIRWGQPI